MTAPHECVIDTTVLQKANAPLLKPPSTHARIRKRLDLLRRIQSRSLVVLISSKLIAEYGRQVREPRNDYVRAFLEVLDRGPVTWNWKRRWSGADQEKARKCMYPREDDHVLRTAIKGNPTTIFSEEKAMLASDACIYRAFEVHVTDPCEGA